jgi:hypothetical protein
LGEEEVRRFLTYLVQQKYVSSSTQNQALNAIIFLYKQVLNKPLGMFGDIPRGQRTVRLPIVFSQNEVYLLVEFAKFKLLSEAKNKYSKSLHNYRTAVDSKKNPK